VATAPLDVVFFGLGSIGMRHLRLLSERFAADEARFFAVRSGARDTATPERVTAIRSLDELPASRRTGVAFVCNPTSLHVPVALDCARRGLHLFLEKPISDSADGLDELARVVAQQHLTAYVAYPLRFLPVVAALREQLGDATRGHVRYVVSSYLASWRPGTDSKDRYSAQRALGGGVILDLSHELDLLWHLFGPLEVLSAHAGRLGNVTLDCEEYADGLLRARGFDIGLHMNFCSLHEQRTLEIDLPDRYLSVNLRSGALQSRTRDADETRALPIERDDVFRRQLDFFFANLGRSSFSNDLTEASDVFRTVLDFKRAALAARPAAS
jgi:predicted dehydrogenase